MGSTTRTASMTYDLNGTLKALTFPAGFTVTYERNADGQVTAIKKGSATLASYAYDPAERLSTRTLSSGVVTTYSYDGMDRLSSIVVSNGSTTLWAERYGYNAVGERILTLTGTTGTVGDAYQLDTTSQVTGVEYGATGADSGYASAISPASVATWDNNAAGNRETQVVGSSATSYTVNAIHQYTAVGSETPTYSTRGDLATEGNWEYTYDVTAETASSTIYEPGIDRPLAEVSDSGTVTFYHQDWLGSVVMLTNTSGAKVQSFTYDVWGDVSGFDASGSPIADSAIASRWLYTGREFDPETGMYHYRARGYSSGLGRFLQNDPFEVGFVFDSDGGFGLKGTLTGKVGPQIDAEFSPYVAASSACEIDDLNGLSLGAFVDAFKASSASAEFAGANSEFTSDPKVQMPAVSGQYSNFGPGILVGAGGQVSTTGMWRWR